MKNEPVLVPGNSGIGETGKVTGGTTSGISSEFELAFDSWRHARAPLARCGQILYRHCRPMNPFAVNTHQRSISTSRLVLILPLRARPAAG
jgi:hypothetical protein